MTLKQKYFVSRLIWDLIFSVGAFVVTGLLFAEMPNAGWVHWFVGIGLMVMLTLDMTCNPTEWMQFKLDYDRHMRSKGAKRPEQGWE